MPYTSNSDIYAAVQDAGTNRVVKHVMLQRPSLFNYGTALVAQDTDLLCSPIEAAPAVFAANNPLVTVIDPLPVVGTSYAMNYAVQLTNGQIDFYPGNIITLPPNPSPLPSQELAVHFGLCAGLGCPSDSLRLPIPPGRLLGNGTVPAMTRRAKALSTHSSSALRPPGTGVVNPIGPIVPIQPQPGPIVLPTQELDCVCLDLYATAGCSIIGPVGNQSIRPQVDGIDIPELAPVGLDKALECYALVALNDGILPTLGDSISTMAFGLINLPAGIGDIQVSASTSVPNNPAIQDDQLELFIDVDQIDINLTLGGSGGGGSGGGGGGGGTITRTTRGRTRTGTFDLTAAVSGSTLEKVFAAFVQGFKFVKSGNGTYGPVSVDWSVAAHLESGSVQLTSTGGIEVKDVVVRWDTLALTLGFDIPKICTPEFCLIPIPFDGCLVDVPAECLFGGDPDLSFSIDLGGFIDSKVTFTGIPRVFYGVGTGEPNQWQIAVEPTLPILLDIVDIADTAADLFTTLITNSIDSLISGLPSWAQDLVNAVLGGVDDIIQTVLGIPDDIAEWLEDLISNMGIFQDLIDALAQYISITLFELDDPFTILPAEGSLIPVQIPIQYIGITVNTSELVVQGDIGD